MKARVGLDITMLRRQRTGVENYIQALAENLPAADDELELTLFSASPLRAQFQKAKVIFSNAGSYAWWRQRDLPRLLKRHGIQLFHSPITAVPLVTCCPVVTTIHDVNWALFPETYSTQRRLGHRFWCGLSVRKARRILVPSEATAQSLVKLHPAVASEKISVVPLFVPRGDDASKAPADAGPLLERLHIKPPFLLAVGTVQLRKNYLRLIEAFERLPSLGLNAHQLVIVGKDGFGAAAIRERARRCTRAGDIRLVGYLSDAETDALYRRAEALAFPSLGEGFGLPLLEAMARGVPVAASNASCLPEVGGDAAVFFEPTNVERMAEALGRVLSDSKLRAELILKGHERVKLFSPQRMAAATAAVYRAVLNENSPSHH
jgi:glycosyltransferase involved in cell wall biosynthesis